MQQLLDSMVAHTLGDCTAAKVARFHAEGLPAARRLAPVTTGSTLTAANVHGPRETEFVTAVMAVITWLVVGLDKRQLKDKAARQQALELLCALSDVLHAQLAAPPSQTSTGSTSSSSRASHKAKGSTLSRVLKLKPAGEATGHTCITCSLLAQLVEVEAAGCHPEYMYTPSITAYLQSPQHCHSCPCWAHLLDQVDGTPPG